MNKRLRPSGKAFSDLHGERILTEDGDTNCEANLDKTWKENV